MTACNLKIFKIHYGTAYTIYCKQGFQGREIFIGSYGEYKGREKVYKWVTDGGQVG
jgi:hypothetical protein